MDNLFLKNIEGYLDKDSNEAKILFLLKEPNAPKGVRDCDGFWFKKCVDSVTGNEKCDPFESSDSTSKRARTTNRRARTRYVNVLAAIAGKILNISVKDFKNIFKHCAYINLYPFSGNGSESVKFKDTLNALNRLGFTDLFDSNIIVPQKDDYDSIAQNRVQIIQKLIHCGECKYVITTRNIYRALSRVLNSDNEGKWLKEKQLRYFEYKGALICEFWHPAYRYLSNKMLNELEVEFGKKD